ncbi:MAG: hypothetical protein M1829_000852 [Trizodia sp. TS-e1964]|nr:MAG: hypothetical protein M1829_000852 [Trizodia sp. TS-e1964]
MEPIPLISRDDHAAYMGLALSLASRSPPKPTNYRVGALIVCGATNTILATGYTLELPGNTHAEQCCLQKLASAHGLDESRLGEVLPPSSVLYTTVEPCWKRLSGNLPCVDRILGIQDSKGSPVIRSIYVGCAEPETFVGENLGRRKLEENGVRYFVVPGLEDQILSVATAGHEKRTDAEEIS